MRAAACAAFVCAFFPLSAGATAFHVTARTEAQAYQVRAYAGADPTTPVLLPRRRVVQYLGLDIWELVTGEDLGFETSLRLYNDFGLPRGEAEQIKGLRSEDADLLYAHVRYRTGRVEAKLGRQYLVDGSDFLSFDGLRARYLHPVGVGAEAFAGLWVKGASLLGSQVYQLDGIRETEGRAGEAGTYGVDPLFEEVRGMEPVFGARLLAENPGQLGVSGALGYRRSILGGRVNSELLSAEARYTDNQHLNAFAHLSYDLVMARPSAFRLLGRYDQDTWAAQVEALRFQPTFSSYSVWYYFATTPRDELRLRGDYTPLGPLRYYVQLLASQYNTAINPAVGLANFVEDAPTSMTFGAQAGAQLQLSQLRSGADVTWRNGWGGRQLWVDLTCGYVGGEGRWSVDGRISVASIRDGFNTLLRGNFYGAQLWGSYQLTKAARASVVVEQNVNPFTRSDTKVFFVFDLKAVL